MHLRELLRAVALTALTVGAAQACPNHKNEVTAARPLSAKQATLLSWKPRAWAPSVALRPSTTTVASAGLRVERDPVDGTLTMPQPDRFEQMVEVGERTPVSVTRMSNGRIRAELDESFAEFAVARIGADGKPYWTCVSGPAGAERLLKSAPAKAPVAVPAPGTKWEDK